MNKEATHHLNLYREDFLTIEAWQQTCDVLGIPHNVTAVCVPFPLNLVKVIEDQ